MSTKLIDFVYVKENVKTGEVEYTVHYKSGIYFTYFEHELPKTVARFIQKRQPVSCPHGGVFYR